MVIAETPLLGLDFDSDVLIHEFPSVGRETFPLGNPVYERNGQIEEGNGEVSLTLSYQHPDEISGAPEFFRAIKYDKEQYRAITGFSIRARDGQTVNLVDLPEGWRSFFSVDANSTLDLQDTTYPDYKFTVISRANLMTPVGVFSHLHEIGHVYTTDFEKEDDARRSMHDENSTRMISPQETEDILVEEANAWTFALNRLMPVLSTDPSDTFYIGDLRRYAYDYILGGYEAIIAFSNLNAKVNKLKALFG